MAAEPALTHIHPAGVQTGKVTEVVMSGKFEPWPCRVWVDVAGIEFVPGKEAGTAGASAKRRRNRRPSVRALKAVRALQVEQVVEAGVEAIPEVAATPAIAGA